MKLRLRVRVELFLNSVNKKRAHRVGGLLEAVRTAPLQHPPKGGKAGRGRNPLNIYATLKILYVNALLSTDYIPLRSF
jgi:hypothetical protein